MVRIEVTHDMAALAIAVIAAWLLLRPPHTRFAAQQPVPKRAGLEGAPEPGGEKITELRPPSRAVGS